jgi:hypothetical protein
MRRILLTVALAWTLAPGSTGARADEAPEDAPPPAPEAAVPQAPAEPEAAAPQAPAEPEAAVPQAPAEPEAAVPQAPAEPEPPKRADVPSVNDPEPEAEFMPSERIPAGSSVSFPVDI